MLDALVGEGKWEERWEEGEGRKVVVSCSS
jgi:hypothetical protein